LNKAGIHCRTSLGNRESDPPFSRFWEGTSRFPIGRESGSGNGPFPDSVGTGNRAHYRGPAGGRRAGDFLVSGWNGPSESAGLIDRCFLHCHQPAGAHSNTGSAQPETGTLGLFLGFWTIGITLTTGSLAPVCTLVQMSRYHEPLTRRQAHANTRLLAREPLSPFFLRRRHGMPLVCIHAPIALFVRHTPPTCRRQSCSCRGGLLAKAQSFNQRLRQPLPSRCAQYDPVKLSRVLAHPATFHAIHASML
jgi:hypothetical protein